MTPPPPDAPSSSRTPGWRSPRRIAFLVFIALLLVFIAREVLDPFGGRDILEIPHGNHVHYVPRDRDPNVALDRFPTVPPGPDERILPNGMVVPREEAP